MRTVATEGLLRHSSLGRGAGMRFLPPATWETKVSLSLDSPGMTKGLLGRCSPLGLPGLRHHHHHLLG